MADERIARHRAAEARRLASEPLLVEFLEKFRVEAMHMLATANATDEAAIRKWQARYAVTGEFLEEMQGIILAAPTEDEPTE